MSTVTDHADDRTPSEVASSPGLPSPAVRVPLHDHRHEITATLVVRGPWADLLGPGAKIEIHHR
jgi:hypothetical protein